MNTNLECITKAVNDTPNVRNPVYRGLVQSLNGCILCGLLHLDEQEEISYRAGGYLVCGTCAQVCLAAHVLENA